MIIFIMAEKNDNFYLPETIFPSPLQRSSSSLLQKRAFATFTDADLDDCDLEEVVDEVEDGVSASPSSVSVISVKGDYQLLEHRFSSYAQAFHWCQRIVISISITVEIMLTICWKKINSSLTFMVAIAMVQIVRTSENWSFIVLGRGHLRFVCLNAVYIVRRQTVLKSEVLIRVYWTSLITFVKKTNLQEIFVTQFSVRPKLGIGARFKTLSFRP